MTEKMNEFMALVRRVFPFAWALYPTDSAMLSVANDGAVLLMDVPPDADVRELALHAVKFFASKVIYER